MYNQAMSMMSDTDMLDQKSVTLSDASYLIKLLAFEILIKCVVLIDTSKYKQNHNYQELFESLSESTRKRTMIQAAHWSGKCIENDDLQKLLAIYESNFVKIRYPFESYKNMTEREYCDYSDLWIELGSPIDEADFQYFPDQLRGLIKALSEQVEEYLAKTEVNKIH